MTDDPNGYFEQNESATDDQDMPIPDPHARSKRMMTRMIAVVLVGAMLFSLFGGLIVFFQIPSIEIFMQSRVLARDVNVRQWQQSVVGVRSTTSSGTGFLVAPDRLIVTNRHIIDDEESIRIGVSMFAWMDVSFAFFDQIADLAVIEEQKIELPMLELELESMPSEDDRVIVIGNPLGFFRMASEAKVVGFTRISRFDHPVLLIKGPVYQGNSGSPVINEDGKVIGILFGTLRTESSNEQEPIGLAIPARTIRQFLDGYLEDGDKREFDAK